MEPFCVKPWGLVKVARSMRPKYTRPDSSPNSLWKPTMMPSVPMEMPDKLSTPWTPPSVPPSNTKLLLDKPNALEGREGLMSNPSALIEYTVTVKGENTTKDLFDDATSFVLDTTLKGKIIDACQTNNVDKDYRHRQHLKTAVSYGVAEFRDIKKFSDGYYDGTQISKICIIYEDNPNFYGRRCYEATSACERLGESGYKIPSIKVLLPSVNDAGTSVKLWDFKNYAISADYSSNALSEDEWKVCTSFPKKVDSNGNVVKK